MSENYLVSSTTGPVGAGCLGTVPGQVRTPGQVRSGQGGGGQQMKASAEALDDTENTRTASLRSRSSTKQLVSNIFAIHQLLQFGLPFNSVLTTLIHM